MCLELEGKKFLSSGSTTLSSKAVGWECARCVGTEGERVAPPNQEKRPSERKERKRNAPGTTAALNAAGGQNARSRASISTIRCVAGRDFSSERARLAPAAEAPMMMMLVGEVVDMVSSRCCEGKRKEEGRKSNESSPGVEVYVPYALCCLESTEVNKIQFHVCPASSVQRPRAEGK